EFELAPGRSRHAEMEPLVEFGVRIARNAQPRGGARDGENFDIAAVECRVDEDVGHRTSIVSPRSEERRVGKEWRCRDTANQAEDGIRDFHVTGVQTCALPI